MSKGKKRRKERLSFEEWMDAVKRQLYGFEPNNSIEDFPANYRSYYDTGKTPLETVMDVLEKVGYFDDD